MKVLKQAFPKSIALQYANFMPGEWLPGDDKGYLRSVYKAAKEMKVGVGGPDLLPHRRGQRNHSYPLIREATGVVPTGVAVQDGNLEETNPATSKPVTAQELLAFATEYLKVDYIFWGTQEPYFSQQVIPLLRQAGDRRKAIAPTAYHLSFAQASPIPAPAHLTHPAM
jgi:hypothetical protein